MRRSDARLQRRSDRGRRDELAVRVGSPGLSVALSVVVCLCVSEWQAWEPSIVPTQEVIPEGSRGSLEVPEKVGPIGGHLKKGKLKHPVLLLDGGIRLSSGKDGVGLVSNGPLSNDGGERLVGNLLLEGSTSNLCVRRVRGVSKTGVKAVIDVDVQDDVLVALVVHESVPLVGLEGVVHDDGVSLSWQILSNLAINVQIKVLDHANSTIESPGEGLIQDSQCPDGAVDGGVILPSGDPLGQSDCEGDLLLNRISHSKLRSSSDVAAVVPAVLRAYSRVDLDESLDVILLQQSHDASHFGPLARLVRLAVGCHLVGSFQGPVRHGNTNVRETDLRQFGNVSFDDPGGPVIVQLGDHGGIVLEGLSIGELVRHVVLDQQVGIEELF